MDELSDQELKRYHRQINLRSIDIDGQMAIKQAKVLVIGLGGLGCAAAQYLTVAGVGHLTLVDGDTVDMSNLQRQVLHTEAKIGMNKAESAKQMLTELNPATVFRVVTEFIDTENVDDLIAVHDVIVDCTDHLAVRQLLNQVCFRIKKPLVSGAAIRFEGQIAIFRWLQDEPCYHCFSQFFSNPGTSPDNRQEDSCVMSGVIAPIVGVVGSFQAMEVLKIVTRAGHPLSGQLLLIDGLNGQFRPMKIRKNPDCPVCGIHN